MPSDLEIKDQRPEIRNKKILVTGFGGFIGSHLTEKLLNDGYVVIGIDEFNDYYDPKIKERNISLFKNNKNFFFNKVDIRDKNSVNEIFARHKPDIVIHLAARAGVRPSLQQPVLYEEVNVLGTLNLLEAAKNNNCKKFIFGSSSSVYGECKNIPFKETEVNLKPISPYGVSKLTGERYCYTYSYLYKIPIICLRFFTVYGPRQRPDLAIYKFTNLIEEGKPVPIFGDGVYKRDFTYITEIIDGITGSMNYDKSSFEIFNLGESHTTSVIDLVKLIESATGKKAVIDWQPIQAGDVPLTYADVSKAEKLLNYKPRTKPEEGIKKFVEWYRENLCRVI
ncbi:MAG: epimerase [Candidatus Melainabacteria bacterium RIFCSPLOWO2_12_FULL_35_11]|nr:MAG: epimerase [Candidatus Melainabacteria bacterium RIFCSPLOWO2_12_FULL_35_11]